LYNNANGDHNVAAGTHAHNSCTGGSYDVAIGGYALFGGTTGTYNTAVGYEAGYSDSTASQNTFVGYRAGKSSNASDVTYIGFDSGLHATGSSNTCLGHRTMDATSCTGGLNTAIGREGLGSLTSGVENTTLGYFAGHDVTTGNYNTIVGSNTGDVVTTGSQNTVVGRNAGQALTTGHYNVYVGYKAGGTSNVDNRLYIARSNSGAGNAATWIHGDEGGNCFMGGNHTTWRTTSDRRLKKNIVDSPRGLAEIDQLRVANFEYKTEDEIDMSEFPSANGAEDVVIGKGNEGQIQTGIIAQEVESVLPECIKTSDHGVKTVNNDPITWALVNAVKELSARVKELESRQ